MKTDVKNSVGKPCNSAFIRRCIVYGIVLAAMIFAAPPVFDKIMVPMAASGIKTAWYTVFVPIVVLLMVIGLFRSWRRRWPMAYMNDYKSQAASNGYRTCPRCGADFVQKKRRRYRSQKVGEEITTTTYSDGSKRTDTRDIYGSVAHTEYYYECSNSRCKLEPEQSISQSHLPWKLKEIRCLVLNENKLLGKKHPSARSILLSRLLIPFLAIIIILACGFTVYSYADSLDGVWTYVTASKESSRSANEYQSYLMSLDTEHKSWHMSYEKTPTDMMSYLGDKVLQNDKTIGYSMESYASENGTTLFYSFEGHDAGTGIPHGSYILMQLDGVDVLIDDTSEKIYKKGTEFYDTYAPKLLALTHDKEAASVLKKVDGGEHALYGSASIWMEYIRKDNTMLYSYMKSNDITKIGSGEFRVITNHPESQMMENWIFSYSDQEYTPNLEGYVYSDAMPQHNDELAKLINKSSEGKGDYTLYRNNKVVIDIDITNLPNGFEYSIDEMPSDFDKELKKDVTYRVNTTAKTLTKVTIDENYLEVLTDMPLTEYQAEYDYLLSIAPEIYIRSIIDMNQAEIDNQFLGLVKNYVMKDEDGKTTAEMKVAFGVIGEVIHHIGKNEYVMIELAY